MRCCSSTVQAGRRTQIHAAGDECDALRRIVMCDAEMVAAGAIPARQTTSPNSSGWQAIRACAGSSSRKRQGGCTGERLLHVEPPGTRQARGEPGCAFVGTQATAGTGIERCTVRAVRGGGRALDFAQDVLPAAEARIEQVSPAQIAQRGLVERKPVGLDQDFAVPMQAEPVQIFLDRLL